MTDTTAPEAPMDPYVPAPPPVLAPTRVRIPAPSSRQAEVAPTASGSSSNGPVINNTNTNTVSPVITANPTNTNTANPVQTNTSTNTNDNRSNAAATATNNNTIYIYPPSMTPPAPAPVASAPSIGPPPLVAPPDVMNPYANGYQPRRIRLNCRQLCQRPPQYAYPPYSLSYGQSYRPTVRKPFEKFRVMSLGGHYTIFGMANQPLVGWGTLQGGGVSLEFRSRGHFGFEMSQDFLHGQFRSGDAKFDRKSYPFELTFKGYVAKNTDRNHFNLWFGGGVGAMSSTITVPIGNDISIHQNFLEWMVHGDIGAEIRMKWFAIGAEGRISALYRDRSYGSGANYGDVKYAPVPASTWGVQGRAFMKFAF
ncbi:MAG: hypothetical protein ABI321_16060 [Polyangia bacterium]